MTTTVLHPAPSPLSEAGSDRLRLGIVGCGNISLTYLTLAPLFRGIEVVACADLNPVVAQARADSFGIKAHSVDDLLADPAIDIVVNLTIPDAHFAVSRAALMAGKHVYSEKPLVLSMAEGLELRTLAAERGLRVGCAPDTFLGGSHQYARHLIDEGKIGDVVAGGAAVMSHGMEHWHPNPDFFFLPGGGPMLDLGPYYLSNLINMIGPVRRVAALANAPSPTRTITSEPRNGEVIPVRTPTNIHALLDFANGATFTISTSWDVWAHKRAHMELYGSEGSLFLPDPNFFGGAVEQAGRGGAIQPSAVWDHPFGVPNQTHGEGRQLANYRTAGLADMAAAIIDGRPHRCSLDLALHGIEVMTAILASGETGLFVAMETSCERPEALGPAEAQALLLPAA
ncbi:Gfo/Idh/MocA family protein [Halodurantibacterium flavum]|uniref:Gfo/Idh/MocA family protein n=1 Tax=Halodurantibacterium flavum TaxID=1382802 RepID=A0ABW4RZU8_9RHOB